jgi:hypothetical protein
MNLGVASIIDIGFPGGPSNNYPSWLDGLLLSCKDSQKKLATTPGFYRLKKKNPVYFSISLMQYVGWRRIHA